MRLRARMRLVSRRINRGTKRASEVLARRRALIWQQLYGTRFRFLVWKQRHGAITVAIILLSLIGLSGFSGEYPKLCV